MDDFLRQDLNLVADAIYVGCVLDDSKVAKVVDRSKGHYGTAGWKSQSPRHYHKNSWHNAAERTMAKVLIVHGKEREVNHRHFEGGNYTPCPAASTIDGLSYLVRNDLLSTLRLAQSKPG
jgi:hypothetical protein